MVCKSCSFTTQRLAVREWHTRSEFPPQRLADFVSALLTTRVTQSLPAAWHGPYAVDRAQEWMKDRDREGVTLLAVERASRTPVGLVILTETDHESGGSEVRLGYLLTESVWGQGLATELVRGFAEWCRTADVATIVAGVTRDNVASRRVLEKSGFLCDPSTEDAAEQRFELRLQPREN